jgi:hypothetical protein
VIDTAESDVVGPAVAADDPHVLAHEVVADLREARGLRTADLAELRAERRDPLPLRGDPGLRALIGIEERADEGVTQP